VLDAIGDLVFGELVEARGGVAGVLGGLSGDVIEQAVDQQGESARAAAPIAPIQPVRGIHGRGIEVAVGGADPDRLVEDDLGEWAGRGEPLRDRGRGLSIVGVDDPLTDAPVGAGKRVRIDTVGDVNSGWTHPAARPLLGARLEAGLEYGAARDHERAVAWLAEGLDLAIATGDRERLVAQMSDLRRASLAALGRELDELEARADEFLAQPPPPRPAWKPDELPGVLAALDAAAKGAVLAPTAAVPAINPSGGRVVLALSWFPREEFAAALEAWPQLADGWDTADHTEYNRRLQRHLAEIQRHLAEMPTAHGPAWIAPIQVDRLRSWCARTGNDPASGSARSRYAAELARTASADLIAWPPARNEPCWCRSGRKYKQCCGHPSVAATPVVP
jgi:hypothetical protein